MLTTRGISPLLDWCMAPIWHCIYLALLISYLTGPCSAEDVGYNVQASSNGVDQTGFVVILDDTLSGSRGVVTSISAYFRNTNPVRFQVWRRQGQTDNYRLIDEFEYTPTSALVTETIVLANLAGAPCMEMVAGDRIGATVISAPSSIVYTLSFNQPSTLQYAFRTPPSVGDTISVNSQRQSTKFSILADVTIGSVCATPAPAVKGDKGQKGQKGAKGEIGEKGSTGDKGEAGSDGTNGIQGLQGDKGDTGSQGAAGVDGVDGAIGPQGPKGDQGDAGIDGLRGATGDKGDIGDTGSKGSKGDEGPQGPNGNSGATGQKGEVGQKGDSGTDGIDGIPGLKGDKGDQGIQGIKGDEGATGKDGPVGPKGSQGITGNTTVVYQPVEQTGVLREGVVTLLIVWDALLTLAFGCVCVVIFLLLRNSPDNNVSDSSGSAVSDEKPTFKPPPTVVREEAPIHTVANSTYFIDRNRRFRQSGNWRPAGIDQHRSPRSKRYETNMGENNWSFHRNGTDA